jgi:adenine-specific DNA-methyltransferase
MGKNIGGDEIEPLAIGVAAWHNEFAPAGETAVAFRSSAFANDVAETNLTAIFEQNRGADVRSL